MKKATTLVIWREKKKKEEEKGERGRSFAKNAGERILFMSLAGENEKRRGGKRFTSERGKIGEAPKKALVPRGRRKRGGRAKCGGESLSKDGER